jgi:hemoglobin/transferrin/lactoferrin receptor protein
MTRTTVPHTLLRAGVLAAVVSSVAVAQDGSTVVSASRSEDPATASPAFDVSVTAEELAATGERSLPRALGRASGVWIQETNLGGGAPVIGGLLGNRIVILVDGVRLNDSTTRLGPNQSLNSIPPEIVERVDVIRGPTSVLYGSDAVGGTILIWTRQRRPAGEDPGARDPQGRLMLSGNSAAEGGRGALQSSFAGTDDGLLVSLGGQSWGDLRAGEGQEYPTAYDGLDGFASWTHEFTRAKSLRLTAQASEQYHVPRTDRLVPGFGQTGPSDQVWDYALQDRKRLLAAWSDEEAGAIADRVDVRLSLRRYVEEREIQDVGATAMDLQRDETNTLGLGADWKRAFGDEHLLTWGFDLEHDMVDSTAAALDLGSGASTPGDGAFAPDAQYTSGGLFAQDELLDVGSWDVTTGLRWSWYHFAFDDFASAGTGGSTSGDFDALTASLAAARDIGRGVRLTAALGQGFRAPNLEDLANESDFAGGTELANPDLDPERSLTAQTAVDITRESWSLAAGVYATWLQDLIGRQLIDLGDPSTTGDETWMRANAGRGEIYGTDLAGNVRLGGERSPWSLDSRLSWVWGQQYDSTVDPSTGEAPFYDVPFRRIPPLFGHVGLVWDGRGASDRVDRADVTLFFADDQERLNPEDLTDPRIDPDGTAGWGRVDVNVEGDLGRADGGATARWHVGLLNLFDQRYRVHASGLDAPGFALVLGLDVSI